MSDIDREIQVPEKSNLTGRYYHKRNFWGSMILMVEVRRIDEDDKEYFAWRRGDEVDILNLGIH